MARNFWRNYRLGHGVFDHYRLDNDGSVVLGGARFAAGEPIRHSFSGCMAVRPAGPDQYLVIRRPDSIPSYFRFEHGAWYRWVPLYRANKWRYEWFALVRFWGPAVCLVPLGMLLVCFTFVAGLSAFVVNPGRALAGTGIFLVLVLACLSGGAPNNGRKP